MLTVQEGRERMAVKPSAEDLARFQELSPIAHVDSVTAPLLFMLGAKDRRCVCGTLIIARCFAVHPPACCRTYRCSICG